MRYQRTGGPGWVGDVFYKETGKFLTWHDIANFTGAQVSVVQNAAKRLGIQYRPRQIESSFTVYEPYTDDEARQILELLRSRNGT